MNQKLKSLSEIAGIAKHAKGQGKKVVTTNGCFDLIHVGHVRNLDFAKSQGDLLIVGLNSDASIRALKGETRPVIPQEERAEVLSALRAVDYVFIFDGSPLDWIKDMSPDVHVKGRDAEKNPAFPAEKAALEACGSRVALAPYIDGKSTTNIIARITKSL